MSRLCCYSVAALISGFSEHDAGSRLDLIGGYIVSKEGQPSRKAGNHEALIRLGGAAILVSVAVHVVANLVLKEFPPANPTLTELRAYLEREAETWKLVHGMRYFAVACLSLFLAAVFLRLKNAVAAPSGGWEYIGLIGGILHIANLFITNGIEMLAFLDFELLANEPDLFWLVFHATRLLFTAEVVAWSILILGFSIGGWKSGALPRFLTSLGFVASALAMLSGLTVGAIMTSGGWPVLAIDAATLTSLSWFLGMGVFLLWVPQDSPGSDQPNVL